jgi:DNA-binding transcriptional LysR family regulator
MELAQVEAFVRVTEEGSFTQAGERLGLTQPAVSARIAALEAALGGPLLERGGRELQLTPLGQRFLPFATRMLTIRDDSLEMVRRVQAGTEGQASLVAIDTLAAYLLPEPLKRFRRAYPAVDLTVRLRLPREALVMLGDGAVSLGLIGRPVQLKGVQVHAHFQEPIQVVAAPHHPLAQRPGPLATAELVTHTLFRVPLHPQMMSMIESLAEQARAASGGAIVWLPAFTAIPLIKEGRGLALLPESFVRKEVAQGELTLLQVHDLPRLRHEPILISRMGHELDGPTAAFVSMMRAEWRHMLVD